MTRKKQVDNSFNKFRKKNIFTQTKHTNKTFKNHKRKSTQLLIYKKVNL
jgi:hypothetical protein